MKLRCFFGPYHWNKVDSELGERWPYIIAFDNYSREGILGYYQLEYRDEYGTGYYWDQDSVEAFDLGPNIPVRWIKFDPDS